MSATPSGGGGRVAAGEEGEEWLLKGTPERVHMQQQQQQQGICESSREGIARHGRGVERGGERNEEIRRDGERRRVRKEERERD